MAFAVRCLICLLFFLSVAAVAGERYEFVDGQQKALFHDTLAQLNCPQCAGQNLAESSSAVAEGLRQLVYELVQQGYSSTEIKKYLQARYGEQILQQPRSAAHRLVLWGIPSLFMLCALLFLLRGIYRPSRSRSKQGA